MCKIAIIILAAGSSSRMRGQDKLMIEIDGNPLLRRTAITALATGCPTFAALPPAPHPRQDALAGLEVTPIPVKDHAEGMNASLRTAVANLPKETKAAMILLADLPDLTTEHLETVLKAVRSDLATGSEILIWRGTAQDGTPGHPVVFHLELFGDLKTLSGDAGAKGIVRANLHRTRDIALPGTAACTDLDTPEAWAAWQKARNQT